ncbi:50S ribosomal protein L3 [endosymbiont DhMRE of Dentiscutata heterogama]|uniref:50S ribosomal protein L3 n=1 Tax=endosymbiont DhMRE of Dentiscutata heterogama TaxID=1609546 RepID=UPI000629D453|nr:50S ribosomal protein L3 [endosymbiont DhMRE of Dentiscutata heterogama]CFW92805.1 50S ribosomal protein L3 [endosymbiont DhMRE of Dentiscutata heterogama]
MNEIGILGNKCRMTQILSEEGLLIPVTPIWIGDNVISQVKTESKEGYNACQIAFGDCTEKNLNKPKLGHLKKNNVPLKRHLLEIRDMMGFPVGSPVDLSHFEVGDEVDVIGNSHGKGTAGVHKRFGNKLGPMSHGAGWPHRLIGSGGGGRGTNQGMPKNKKMPGRMGNKRVTQKSRIEKKDPEKRIIFLRGAVPGPVKGLVVLRKKDTLSRKKTKK